MPARPVLFVAIALLVAACSNDPDKDLWQAKFAPPTVPGGPPDVTGYWEGTVTMGSVRMKIARDGMIIALRCDADGKRHAQAQAKSRIVRTAPARIVLDEDLAGGDDDCGFHFSKGDEFEYARTVEDQLNIALGRGSVPRLSRLASLPAKR